MFAQGVNSNIKIDVQSKGIGQGTAGNNLRFSITDFSRKVKVQHFAENALYRLKNCSNL